MSTKFLCIPYEKDAPECRVTLGNEGEAISFVTRVSEKNIDSFMRLPLCDRESFGLPSGFGKTETLIRAAYITEDAPRMDEKVRPVMHMTIPTGAIAGIESLTWIEGEAVWRLSLICDSVSQSGRNPLVKMIYESRDLIHWNHTADETAGDFKNSPPKYWKGDVGSEICCSANDGRTFVIASSKPDIRMPVPLSNFLGIPAVLTEGGLVPAREIENLRIWKRYWQCIDISQKFEFEARFQVVPYPGNSQWPKMSFRESTCTQADVRADAVEAELSIFVGQEPYIDIDFCGVKWHWDAHSATLSKEDGFSVRLWPQKGRISLRLFADKTAQEIFTHEGEACIVSVPDGTGKVIYNNPQTSFFRFAYQREPYIAISTEGASANLIELNFYGLRRAGFSPELLKETEKMEYGKLLYTGKNFKVYDNCIDDFIYGDPVTWVSSDVRKIYSPVRLTEDFQEPQNKWWRNKSRVINREDCFCTPELRGRYPELITNIPVLSAAYKVAAGVLMKDVSEEFCLPGEEGLLAASLEQGPGAGGGMWVRDTNQAAFRSMNLLCPFDIRKSLSEVVKRGIANGSDGAAMPAIGIWDYYLATGDKALLFETLHGIIRNAEETDAIFNRERNLVPADDVLDAIPEPELNDGFCFATNVFYAHMYICTSKICCETDSEIERRKAWLARGESMLDTLRSEYWNEEAGCFSNGPRGSVYYRNGWWESTGAELALWPRFGIADDRQRKIFLNTIKKNPRAFTDFGINMFPFKPYGNFFWNQVWVAWQQGIAVAAAEEGDLEFLGALIFQQIRNSVTTRDFHECIDADTGRAWSWPGLAWHAAGFLGYIISAVFGIRYDEKGIYLSPAVPEELYDIGLSELKYRDMTLEISVKGFGKNFKAMLDGQQFDGFIPLSLRGKHIVMFEAV